MKNSNKFKTTSGHIPPERQADFKKRDLKPPVFEDARVSCVNPGIAWNYGMSRAEKGRFV